ncbi:MAG: hypothetical protein M1815_003859 [Lichina confinis]|nr:MAG: hypothetical protein M1815_003859 [Lichina confinis]
MSIESAMTCPTGPFNALRKVSPGPGMPIQSFRKYGKNSLNQIEPAWCASLRKAVRLTRACYLIKHV